MTGDVVSINSVWFWAVVAVAVFAMRALSGSRWRPYAFALVNLLFLAILLRERVVLVVGGLAVIGAMLALLDRRPTQRIALWIGGNVLLALFVFHKAAHGFTMVASPLTSSVLVAVGFSYVTLQLIEVMRAVNEGAERRPSAVELVNYLLPFHMLAAGPIQAYQDFLRQPAVPPPLDQRAVLEGLDRIARGVFKKFVLAYAIHKLFLTGFTGGFAYSIFEAQMTLLWLYLDFSAYSDIAVGVGRLMGVATPENFDRPFRARNLMEFWDRWHISLSLWIRRNLFFPIQIALVRRSETPHPLLFAAIATLVAFTLAGLWHGLDRGWFIWGLLHAIGLIAMRLWGHLLQQRLDRETLARYRSSRLVHGIAVVLTFEYVAFAFVPVFVLAASS